MSYNDKKWWWFILYLNMAGTKKADPDTYDMLLDMMLIVFNQEEDSTRTRRLFM
jgi:hypothetical protein